MKAEYKRDWSDKTVILFEHEIEFNGCSFLVIFGKHVNGGFICIPNWQISCEASADGNVLYNTEKLHSSGLDEDSSLIIAKYIKDLIDDKNIVASCN